MRVSHPLQDVVLAYLTLQGVASLREITHATPLQYYQVASVLVALCAKGYVERIDMGKYKITDLGEAIIHGPDAQIRYLQRRVSELEALIKRLRVRLVD